MKAIYTGTLNLALLVLPVRLGTVVSGSGPELHRYRKSDASPMRMKRIAEADGADLAWEDTQPGYKLADGTVVLLGEDELRQAFGENAKQVRVITFTDLSKLPRTASAASYYVQPDKNADKGYALLAETLKRTGRAAVVTLMLRERESYALLYTDGHGYLILEMLHWAASVKKPDFAAPSADLSRAELDLAENLVTQTTADFDWENARDAGAERLELLVQGKAETGQAVGTPAPQASSAATTDLAAALLASVEQAKKSSAPKPRTRAPRGTGARKAA